MKALVSKVEGDSGDKVRSLLGVFHFFTFFRTKICYVAYILCGVSYISHHSQNNKTTWALSCMPHRRVGENVSLRAAVVAWLVKCLPCKPEDTSSSP